MFFDCYHVGDFISTRFWGVYLPDLANIPPSVRSDGEGGEGGFISLGHCFC